MAAFFIPLAAGDANHMNTITSELIRRCEARKMCTATTAAAAVLGAAVDAGLIALPDLLDLVRSCSTADQLGDALCMLAATVPASGISEQTLAIRTGEDWPPVGCPPGHEHRVFRVVGEPDGGDTWAR
jgi:hypothetical protein